MWDRVLPAAIVCAAVLVAAPAELPAQAPNWIRLHSAAVDGKSFALTVSLPEGSPRVQAIRLIAPRTPISVSRVVVNYNTGQVHFEERAFTLRAGERSPSIDERPEARVVEFGRAYVPEKRLTAAGCGDRDLGT